MFTAHGVHAASAGFGYGVPLDDHSVSALTSLDQAMEAVASKVTPSIVNVAVTSRGSAEDEQSQGNGPSIQGLPPEFQQFFGGGGMRMMPQQPQIEHGIGSGVIISPDGYIVTNNHVVQGATQIRVTLNDRRVLTGHIVGTDKLTDIAVIKVDAHNLPAIAWGDSTELRPGQTVLAFGSPFGSLQFSVTRGIVSAINRPNSFSGDARTPGGLIQTDAAINPGNSGGALVNAHGELVGINNGIMTSSGSFAGAGFAIPSQIVRSVSQQLIAHGKVDHGFLGINMNDVTPANAQFFDLKDASGAIVAQVTPDSPASRGGVKQGDVIVKVKKVQLTVSRNGQPVDLNLTVGSYHAKSEVASNDDDPQDGQPGHTGKLGLAVADLSSDIRQQINAPDSLKGVVVQNVRPDSPAEDAGLQPGDVILEVDRKPATSASQFVGEVHQAPAGKNILLLVWSKGNASYRTIQSADQNG
jgi:serine protease Do